MNFPLTIKGKRKELGETQEQFGKRFGVSHASVSDWESGKTEAPYKVLEFLLDQGEPQEEECCHEWRQLIYEGVKVSGGGIPERFYCIKCLKKSQYPD